MKGIVFDFNEPYYDLSEVILTKSRFSCDYRYEDDRYHIEATSSNGIEYRGNWGFPRLDENYTVELQRFENKTKEVVILGAWKNATDNEEGVFLFRLNP